MLVCKHQKKENRTFSVPGIIKSGLCYNPPIIMPEYSADDPLATEFNSPELYRHNHPEFDKAVKEKYLELLYNFQQEKHIALLDVLESLPRDYAKCPPYHNMISQATPINCYFIQLSSMANSARKSILEY